MSGEAKRVVRDLKRPAPPAEALPDIRRLLAEILGEIRSMSFTPREKREFTYLTYPADGTKKSIGKGTMVVDFLAGEVILPDGTKEYVSSSLRAYEEPLMRSVFVETDKEIKVQLDEYGKYPVDADDFFLMTWTNFTRLTIYTTETTEVAVEACTNPEAVLKKVMTRAVRGVINTYNRRLDPVGEFGTPVCDLDSYTGTATTYQTLAEWTVTSGHYGVLREVSMTHDTHAQYKLVIDGVTQFEDEIPILSVTLPFPPNKLSAGAVVTLYVKSDDGTSIDVSGSITGKEVLAS